MTAIICVPRERDVLVYTDSAVVGPSGKFEALAEKQLILARLGAVIACRGSWGVLPCVAFAVREAQSFDALVAMLPDVVRRVEVGLKKEFQPHGPVPLGIDLVVAGWSENGPRAFFVTNMERVDLPAYAPNEIWPGPNGWPNPEPAVLAALARGVPNLVRFNPVSDPVKLMESQRRAFPGHIGGSIVVTQVQQNGITSKTIHRWPDRIGESILPAGTRVLQEATA